MFVDGLAEAKIAERRRQELERRAWFDPEAHRELKDLKESDEFGAVVGIIIAAVMCGFLVKAWIWG